MSGRNNQYSRRQPTTSDALALASKHTYKGMNGRLTGFRSADQGMIGSKPADGKSVNLRDYKYPGSRPEPVEQAYQQGKMDSARLDAYNKGRGVNPNPALPSPVPSGGTANPPSQSTPTAPATTPTPKSAPALPSPVPSGGTANPPSQSTPTAPATTPTPKSAPALPSPVPSGGTATPAQAPLRSAMASYSPPVGALPGDSPKWDAKPAAAPAAKPALVNPSGGNIAGIVAPSLQSGGVRINRLTGKPFGWRPGDAEPTPAMLAASKAVNPSIAAPGKSQIVAGPPAPAIATPSSQSPAMIAAAPGQPMRSEMKIASQAALTQKTSRESATAPSLQTAKTAPLSKPPGMTLPAETPPKPAAPSRFSGLRAATDALSPIGPPAAPPAAAPTTPLRTASTPAQMPVKPLPSAPSMTTASASVGAAADKAAFQQRDDALRKKAEAARASMTAKANDESSSVPGFLRNSPAGTLLKNLQKPVL